MSFVTYAYFVFLFVSLIIYYICPYRFRWGSLLGASIVFLFMLDVYSMIWIIFTTVITFGVGILIEKLTNIKMKKILMYSTLIVCFGALAVVKYSAGMFSYFVSNGYMEKQLSIVMPIGISFYMFQVAGYLIDVYTGKINAIRHLGHYAVAVTFFAKLTQGPIVPIQELVLQFIAPVKIDVLKIRGGAVTILFGLFKKVVVADRLAVVANSVFSAPNDMNGLSALLGIVFYTFQLYADFAGYTDIAVGSAMLFGIDIPHNFNQPYLARSIGEFWRRWHITLSTWLKNYIYIPLGGSRVSRKRWALNTMIVFFISGIWHGNGFTFIVWGLLHGLYQVIGRYTKKMREKIKEKAIGKDTWMSVVVSTLITFMLVSVAWTFFRATSLSDACHLLLQVIKGPWALNLAQVGVKMHELCFSLGMIGIIIAMDLIEEKIVLVKWVESQILPIRWIIYLGLLFVLILFGMYGSLAADSFIYVSF